MGDREKVLRQSKETLEKALKRAIRGDSFNATAETIANIGAVLLALINLELQEIEEHGKA